MIFKKKGVKNKFHPKRKQPNYNGNNSKRAVFRRLGWVGVVRSTLW